ncbi:MAG: hypothetical protein LAN70_10440 [Acidobacteriia bacterium]|nr:hypothetical protein [Terriglobia bacterium]
MPRIVLGWFAVSVTSFTATPSPISIAASDPDTNPTPSASATLRWTQAGATINRTWNVKVTAPASFPGCSTVPISAVTITCDSVSATNTGGGWTGTCAGSATLNTTGVTFASGTEGNSSSRNLTVNLHYNLADSWKYIGGSCSLNLTYTVTAN